jgi:hypothetical protein
MGIAVLCFLGLGTRRGEGSASRPGRSLPPEKTRYPLYRRLGGPQGRSVQVRKISRPPGFDPRTVQAVARRYTDWGTHTIMLHVSATNATVALNMSSSFTEMSAWWWLLVTAKCSIHYILEYIVVFWLNDILNRPFFITEINVTFSGDIQSLVYLSFDTKLHSNISRVVTISLVQHTHTHTDIYIYIYIYIYIMVT